MTLDDKELQIKKLKKRAQEAEGELTISKGIGNTSPEMRALQKEVGNLQVQNADYQQIVQELSDKLSKYETLHGTVFVKGPKT